MRLIRGLGKVLWFELLWKVLVLVVVSPLFQDVYQTYVASVGVSFNSGILSTFLSLKGAALFAVLFLADRKSTRLNSSHIGSSRMPSSA